MSKLGICSCARCAMSLDLSDVGDDNDFDVGDDSSFQVASHAARSERSSSVSSGSDDGADFT